MFGGEVHFLYDYFPHLSPGPCTVDTVQSWYAKRALEIEQRTGSVGLALTMLQAAHDRFVPINTALDRVQLDLEELNGFVYLWGIDKAVSLAQFRTLTPRAKLAIFVQRLEECHEAGEMPTVALCTLIGACMGAIEDKLTVMLALTKEKGVWLPLMLIKLQIVSDKREIIQLTLALAFDDEQLIDIGNIEKLVYACPRKQKDELAEEHAKLDYLQALIKAAKLIGRHEVRCSIGDLIGRANDKGKVENMFRLMIKKGRAKYDGSEVVRWISILQDVLQLQKTVFSGALVWEEAKAIFIEELLNFAVDEAFLALTRRLICQSASQEADLLSSSGALVSAEFINVELLAFAPTAAVVFRVAERFVLGATDLHDGYLNTALRVLSIIEMEEPGEVMIRHRRQVAILQLMAFFREKLNESMFGTDHELLDQLTPVNIGRLVDTGPLELIDLYIRINDVNRDELEQLTQLLATFNGTDLYPISLIRAISYLLDNQEQAKALVLCNHLINGKCKPSGWQQVKRCAASAKIRVEDQERLLLYVLTHCTADQIEDVLDEIETIRQARTSQQSLLGRLSSVASNDESEEKLQLTKITTYEQPDQQRLLSTLMGQLMNTLDVPANFALATLCHDLVDDFDFETEAPTALKILFVCYMETLKIELNLARLVLGQVIEIETTTRSRLLDFIYGEDLLVYGINVVQFFADAEYRADSISGLADMEGDQEALALAVQLANRHNIDRFKILINHVETTINNVDFGSAGYGDVKLDVYLKTNVLDEIKDDERFPGRLEKYCWPQLNGRDHRRLKLYWLTQLMASQKSAQKLAFLDVIAIHCNQVDFKGLLEADKPAELVDLLDDDMTASNVINVDQSLTRFKTHYEAFSMATEWLIRNVKLMNKNLPELIDVTLKLPDTRQTVLVDECTYFDFDQVESERLDQFVNLFTQLAELEKATNETDIVRKIAVCALFATNGPFSKFEKDTRAMWMRAIFDTSTDLDGMILTQLNKMDIIEWFGFVQEIGTLVDTITLDNYISRLVFNDGKFDETMIDSIDEYGKCPERLRAEVRAILTNKQTEVPLAMLIKLLKQLSIELEEYHLSAHVTRILLSIQYDENYDDFKIAKKIHQLGQLLKLAAPLTQMIEGITRFKCAVEFAQTNTDENHRAAAVTAITEFDQDQCLTVVRALELDIVSVLRVAGDMGQLAQCDLVRAVIGDKIELYFNESVPLFEFIDTLKNESDVYMAIAADMLMQQVGKHDTLDISVVKGLLGSYPLIDVPLDTIINSVELYKTIKLDKESLTKDGEFFKSMVKVAKERSSEKLK